SPFGGAFYNDFAGRIVLDTEVHGAPFLLYNNGLVTTANHTIYLPGGISTGTFHANDGSYLRMGSQHLTNGARVEGDGIIIFGYAAATWDPVAVTTFSGVTTLAGAYMFVVPGDGYEDNGIELTNSAAVINITGSLNFWGGFLRGRGTVDILNGGAI